MQITITIQQSEAQFSVFNGTELKSLEAATKFFDMFPKPDAGYDKVYMWLTVDGQGFQMRYDHGKLDPSFVEQFEYHKNCKFPDSQLPAPVVEMVESAGQQINKNLLTVVDASTTTKCTRCGKQVKSIDENGYCEPCAEERKPKTQTTEPQKLKFNKHNVHNITTNEKCRVSYSLDNRIDNRKCVTLYAKGYQDDLFTCFPDAKNESDSMTDYFEKDRINLFEDHPHYAAARKVAEQWVNTRGW
jgi:ribosomal protein L37E